MAARGGRVKQGHGVIQRCMSHTCGSWEGPHPRLSLSSRAVDVAYTIHSRQWTGGQGLVSPPPPPLPLWGPLVPPPPPGVGYHVGLFLVSPPLPPLPPSLLIAVKSTETVAGAASRQRHGWSKVNPGQNVESLRYRGGMHPSIQGRDSLSFSVCVSPGGRWRRQLANEPLAHSRIFKVAPTPLRHFTCLSTLCLHITLRMRGPICPLNLQRAPRLP